tara:strand:+ start:802 stop:1332 length:531 start_codon:yes stop_codon:yes gene_type:complete
MAYFKYFNKIGYDIHGDQNRPLYEDITNILQRVRLRLDNVKYHALFAKHIIIDGQTPEYLAHEFYGDTELHWVILYAHQATNPYYDWPLTYHDLSKYVVKKYGVGQTYEPNHYEDSDGYWVDPIGDDYSTISHFAHEEKVNDAKRQLMVVRPEHVQDIVAELKGLLKYSRASLVRR